MEKKFSIFLLIILINSIWIVSIPSETKFSSYLNENYFSSDIQAFRDISFSWNYFCEDSLDWGVDEIDAEKVWGGGEDEVNVLSGTYNYAGRGVKLCIIDTGIDTDHDDLASNYKGGWDFYDGDSTPEDVDGHGTACAGIISAVENDWGTIGVSPEVDLYVARNGKNIPFMSLTAKALNWSINNEMSIISMSFGGSEMDSDVIEPCMEAYKKGILLVAATGNLYTSVSYPAKLKCVIGVGAVVLDPTDNTKFNLWCEGPYEGTNHGVGLELLAPGGKDNIYTTDLDNSHRDDFGMTSAAAPHVAGVCALILEANPNLLPGEVRFILRESAREDCFSDNLDDFDENGYSEFYGYGLINAEAAIDYVLNEYQRTDSDNDGFYNAEEKVWGTDILNSDSDGDGIPDGWEFRNLLEPSNEEDYDDDFDGDGLTNLQEYNNDTDPNDSDSDDDGLSDGEEVNTYYTNPNDSDSDNDGCDDAWEIYYGYDPNVSNGALDEDNDDLRNIDECFIGTHPNNSDTDGDFISDGDEVFWNLDPLDASDADDDDDNDGLTNLEEINGWFDLNDDGDYDDTGEKNVYQTKPNDADTDGDGWNDYQEQYPLHGPPTDPTDSDDHPPFFP